MVYPSLSSTHAASPPRQHESVPVLLIPGLDNSPPGHWQSLWERDDGACRRVELGLWDKPHRNTWINQLNLAIHRAGRPVVLVAHSLGCLVAAWWAHLERPSWGDPVRGALLVAPPEVDFLPLDERLTTFAPTPSEPLPFPSIVVASRNDPWMGFLTARHFARGWGGEFVDAGEAGHLNTESDLGHWPDGRRLLARLLEREADAGGNAEARRTEPGRGLVQGAPALG